MNRISIGPICVAGGLLLTAWNPQMGVEQEVDQGASEAPAEPSPPTDALAGDGTPAPAGDDAAAAGDEAPAPDGEDTAAPDGAGEIAEPEAGEAAEMPPGVLSLFQRGMRQLEAERWTEARDTFRAARAVWDRPNTVFNLALALYHGSELLAAEQAFEDFDGMAEPSNPNRAEAKRLAALATAGIAELTVILDPPDAELIVDGKLREETGAERKLRLDPGAHQIRVEMPEYIPLALSLRLEPGQRQERRFQLDLLGQPQASQSWPLGPSILVGGGGTLLVAALVTGILTSSAEGSLEEKCNNLSCRPTLEPTINDGQGLQVATNVLLVLGSAAAVAGGIWWLLTPTEETESQHASLGCSLDGCHAVLRGEF